MHWYTAGLVAAALQPAPPLGAFLEDQPARSQRPNRPPRSTSNESLAAINSPPSSALGPAHDSAVRPLPVRARRVESVEVLRPLAAAPSAMPWAPCLDGAAVFSRYTIITPEQDAVAELPPLLTTLAPFGEWFVSSALRARPSRARAFADDAILHTGPTPPDSGGEFELAGTDATIYVSADGFDIELS